MTQIKICGITNLEDALVTAESGSHALGFIFYGQSPRYVSPEDAAEIIRNLPERVTTVGVFVNHDAQEVREIAENCLLDMIQLHGDEPPEYARELSDHSIIRAIAPRNDNDLLRLKTYPADAILIDGYDPRLYGGTGKEANWDVALHIKERYPLILSGGLTVDNLEGALHQVAPQAVDINSGCEEVPGKKDHGKIRTIIEIVRCFDKDFGTVSAGIFRKAKRMVHSG